MALRNKKGDLASEFVLWFFRFLVLILIIAAIVAAVGIFYSGKYDVRSFEASALGNSIAECIINKGVVTEQEFNSAFDKCVPTLDENEYYVNLSISYGGDKLPGKQVGEEDTEMLCQLKKSRMKYKPYCTDQRYYVLFEKDGSLNRASLDILIGIRKVEKNVT
ncbi:MAG: hypothetical protein V1660_01540 [archaeon]